MHSDNRMESRDYYTDWKEMDYKRHNHLLERGFQQTWPDDEKCGLISHHLDRIPMIESHDVPCPYCGETFEALIDTSLDRQQYIEDCEVCCRPIVFKVVIDSNGSAIVETRHEDDT